jgi:ubiquinone/menaquinone biosynthesis C-methylase UbiE
MSVINPFDAAAQHYDAWFDTARGHAIFESEVACLRLFVAASFQPWLEVGVGTGRFAQALKVEAGIDPSAPMLAFAAMRGIKVCQGIGEELPYENHGFGGVLTVVTLCFLEDPDRALREIARVLKPGGRLVVGIIPAESPWGRKYADRGRQGHPIYRRARFYKLTEAISLIESAGFQLQGICSTLLNGPETEITEVQPTSPEALPVAGFVAMSFHPKNKNTVEQERNHGPNLSGS